MMKISKFKIKKTKGLFKKLPRILAEHSFLTFLGFLLISLIIGGFIFYQYSFLPRTTFESKVAQGLIEKEEPLQLKEKIYEAILETWQEKEKRFEGASLKEYPDLFR
jgi:hypothetical protein